MKPAISKGGRPEQEEMAPQPGKKKAVQLISISDDGKFVIDEEAMAAVARVQQPICVVMIAGMARTGKSFLLSQLSDSPGVFEVGHRTASCTQGIWMVNQPVTVTLD